MVNKEDENQEGSEERRDDEEGEGEGDTVTQ